MRVFQKYAFACLAGLIGNLLLTSAVAQTSGVGNIAGTVTDSTGALVGGATVVITDTDTGISRTLTTTGAGSYTANFLQPGHYEVVLGGGQFSRIDRKNLLLTVGETLTVDAALPAGSVSTEVEVTSASPLLDTEKTEVSQTFDPVLIANLPVATRNWSAFVLNTPNVVQDGGSGLVSFHGISGLYNQNYVDGSNNNQMLFSEARGRSSGAPYVYSIDSIKEFQAETSNYSVEFGQGRRRPGQRHHQERHQRHPRRPVLLSPLPHPQCARSLQQVPGPPQRRYAFSPHSTHSSAAAVRRIGRRAHPPQQAFLLPYL